MSNNTFLWDSLEEELRYQRVHTDEVVQRRVQALKRRDLTDTQLRAIVFYTMALGLAHYKQQKETR
jgi:hypothetical protein